MKYAPRRHQQIAAEFMREHNRCALFLDMGLGKTVVTLTRINELINVEFCASSALVIAPKRVAEDTWSREVDKWEHLSGLTVSKVLGSRAQREAALAKRADVYVINRENVEWLYEYLGSKWHFDIVVIDELSSFKSTSAKRWRALRKTIFTATYVYGLTGTPASNGYLDLYAEMYLIDGGQRLGRTLGQYRTEYFTPGGRRGYVVFDWRLKHGSKERIDKKLSDICLSMSKDDWLDMPACTYNTIPVTLDKKGREAYDFFENEKLLPLVREAGELAVAQGEDFDSAIVGDMAATVTGKLLQMANGAVYDDEHNVFHIHDAKLDALEDIQDTANGQPLLVFYSYQHDCDRLLKRFPKAEKMKDASTIKRWNDGEIPMLLCHPASAGHGLNLQEGGHIIVWFGLPWSLEQYQQANARLYRMGQKEHVIIHHLIAEDTVDGKVLRALTDKDATQASLLNALKNYVKEKI